MGQITLQIHLNGAWHDAATVDIAQPALGIGGPASFDYDLDYWMHQASSDGANGKRVIEGYQKFEIVHATERHLMYLSIE